jgi:hypothetical protein
MFGISFLENARKNTVFVIWQSWRFRFVVSPALGVWGLGFSFVPLVFGVWGFSSLELGYWGLEL